MSEPVDLDAVERVADQIRDRNRADGADDGYFTIVQYEFRALIAELRASRKVVVLAINERKLLAGMIRSFEPLSVREISATLDRATWQEWAANNRATDRALAELEALK